jgi:predicted secreted protein
MVKSLSQCSDWHRRPYALLFLTLCIVFLSLGLAACGGSSPSASSSATNTPAAVPTHITINTKNEKIVTLADNNTTITVKSGTTVEVILNDSSTGSQSQTHWLLSISRSDVLIPWANAPMPAQAQGIFNAGKVGTAQISAVGQPVCSASAKNCKKDPETFQMKVNVD